jgi:hypothetical protein
MQEMSGCLYRMALLHLIAFMVRVHHMEATVEAKQVNSLVAQQEK